MGCGATIAQTSQPAAHAETKGWFTDGVRTVANFVTGGQLNRDIQREQQAAVNQQARAAQGEIREAQQSQRAAEQAQIRAEREAERARDREVVQPSVLRMFGWNLMHIWSIDWLLHQDMILKRINDRIYAENK
jgi:hypothetical protein